MSPEADILVLDGPVPREQLRRLVDGGFRDMVKYVVDLRRDLIAIGGQLHADAESLLLESGSLQEDLWGANYYPGRGATACIEFTSLINIRPAQSNPGMEVADPAIRLRIRELTHRLIGAGEAL